MSQKLHNYIERRLDETGMSGRAAAAAMGISHPYFVRVYTGKVERPGIEFCKKLAELFDDSFTKVMRLAGWIPKVDSEETVIQEVLEMAEKDPRFLEILKVYQDLTSEGSKDAFLTIVKAALEALEQSQSKEGAVS